MQVTGHKVTKPMKEKILYLTNGMRYNNNNNMVHTTNIRGRTCSCEQASGRHKLLGGFLFSHSFNSLCIKFDMYVYKNVLTKH